MKVLITGAVSGIGFSVAKLLSIKGHDVYVTTHTEEQLNNVKEKIRQQKLNINSYKMDIRKKSDRNILKKINPDVLINHAGIGNGGTILEMDIDVLRDNYETNVFSSFSLLQEFYQLKEEHRERGKIFVTSSIASMIPIPYLGCYTSSKAAISMLTKTIELELKYMKKNISISLIEPGAFHTGFNQVMIDNKEKFLYKDSYIYKNIDNINRLQRNMFILLEKQSTKSLVSKIVKEVEKEKPKFLIRKPFLQSFLMKIYILFFR